MYKTDCPICDNTETVPHPEKDKWRVCLECDAKWNTELIKVPVDQ